MTFINTDYNTSKINPESIWSSLGWKGQNISNDLIVKTQEAIKLCQDLARPRTITLSGELNKEGGKLTFHGIDLEGESIKEFLSDSDECFLLAATLGLELDRKIKSLENTDLTLALLLDSAASVLVEQVCDKLTKEIEEIMKQENKYITERYSPGYGDLPLSLQPEIISLLDATRKIGLSCSESSLLYPRKSVTAFIGIMDKPRKPKFNRCSKCRLKDECKYGLCAFSQN